MSSHGGECGDLASTVLDRIADAEAASALERVRASGLVGQGKVNLIGLDAIKVRLGERWGARVQQVHDHVDKTLARHLGLNGYFVRVTATDYLVAQPERSRHRGQVACLAMARDLLTHFLGEAATDDLDIREVTGLSEGAVEARRLDPVAVDCDAGRLLEGEGQEDAAHLGSPDSWSPFVSASGARLDVVCGLEPVFELSEFQQIGFRITRNVFDLGRGARLSRIDQGLLTPGDIERIDMATIARGLNRIRAQQKHLKPAMLMISASHSTFGTRRGLAAMIGCLKEARESTAVRVICEIKNIEGVPGSTLSNTVAMLKPACYAIFARLERVSAHPPPSLCTARPHGVSFKHRQAGREVADVISALEKDVQSAREAARAVMVLGLSETRDLGLAKLAGASHASLRAPTSR